MVKMFTDDITIYTNRDRLASHYIQLTDQYNVEFWSKSNEELSDYELWVALKFCYKRDALGKRRVPGLGPFCLWNNNWYDSKDNIIETAIVYTGVDDDNTRKNAYEILHNRLVEIVNYADTKYTQKELDDRFKEHFFDNTLSNDELCKLCFITSLPMFRRKCTELGFPTNRTALLNKMTIDDTAVSESEVVDYYHAHRKEYKSTIVSQISTVYNVPQELVIKILTAAMMNGEL